MITKIVPDDIFTTQLQSGESRERPVHIIVGTNTEGVNTHWVAHHIGTKYNANFQELLRARGGTVELGHVFSHSGNLDGHQRAMFHAVAVNKRLQAGGPQDWTELLASLKTGLENINLMQSIHDERDKIETDTPLIEQIAALDPRKVDFPIQARRLTDAHIAATRRHFRVVLIGGADGQKNDADLEHTLQALEETDLLVHLYLGHGAQRLAQAVNRVIPAIPALKDRNLLVTA